MTASSLSTQPDPLAVAADITAATERLFLEIAGCSNNPAVATHMQALIARMEVIRPYEAALISNRADELAALSTCWQQRDFVSLQTLLSAYFQRRLAIVPQIIDLINRPN